MKKIMGFLFVFGCMFLTSLIAIVAFGQAASPTPAPLASTDVILSGISVVQTFQAAGLWAGIAALVNLLINVLKTNTFAQFYSKILSPKLQSLFVLGLGVVVAIIGVKIGGGSWLQGVAIGVPSAAGATFFHELWQDIFASAAPTVAPSA